MGCGVKDGPMSETTHGENERALDRHSELLKAAFQGISLRN